MLDREEHERRSIGKRSSAPSSTNGSAGTFEESKPPEGQRLEVVVPADSAGRLAMLLAVTATRAEETAIREVIAAQGVYRCAVTEVGGKCEDYGDRVFHAVVGAALNSGLIAKTPFQMHALLHATVEAERAMLINIPGSSSLSTKVAIVTDKKWIAVAIFGVSAFHPLTNHERAGLGMMHLGE